MLVSYGHVLVFGISSFKTGCSTSRFFLKKPNKLHCHIPYSRTSYLRNIDVNVWQHCGRFFLEYVCNPYHSAQCDSLVFLLQLTATIRT